MRRLLGIGVMAVTAALASCSASPVWLLPLTTSELWAAGDSIVAGGPEAPSWVDYLDRPAFNIGANGAGFVVSYNGYTIGAVIAAYVGRYGAPDRILLSGGANDAAAGVSEASAVFVMADLEAYLTALGTEVVWVTAPPLGWPAPALDSTNAWMRSRPNHVDCGPLLGGPVLAAAFDYGDLVHLSDAGDRAYAACVSGAL